MGYKRKLFNDKTIVAAAAVGVLAISAIVGGVMLGGADNDEIIVDLDNGNGTGTDNPNYNADNTNTEKESGHVVSDDKNIIAENVDNKKPDDTSSNKNNSDNITKPQGTGDNKVPESNEDKNNTSDKDKNKDKVTTGKQDETSDVNALDGVLGLNFTQQSTLVWPVEGNVIIDYDMENTVYFATLDLYKCSDAVCIQSAVGTPVYAGSSCSVENIEYDSEIGNNVTVSLGNGYMLTYGQLKDVQVTSGDVIEEGDLIGYVGNPTKYYSVEGSHLYMKMTHDGKAVDPLDYLNYNE